MDFEAIRTELLRQHQNLRRMIEQTRQSARVPAGSPRTAELPVLVDRLAEGLREHNRREEELLATFLPTVDAWGTVRQEVVTREHVSEHDELAGALDDLGSLLAGAAREALLVTLDRVLEHMAREEKMFLTDASLCETGITAEQVSG